MSNSWPLELLICARGVQCTKHVRVYVSAQEGV